MRPKKRGVACSSPPSSKPSDPLAQIIGYLTEADRARFQAYAQALGLDVSALANLLIIRELKLARLSGLAGRFDQETPASSRTKVTAHLPVADTKAAFAALAARAGMKPTRAAAVLFRTELEERWLESSVAVNQIDSA